MSTANRWPACGSTHRCTSSVSPVSPVDATGRLLPEITARTDDPVGAADKRVQAYNFRLCMTKTAGQSRRLADAGALRSIAIRTAGPLPAGASKHNSGVPLAINDVMKADSSRTARPTRTTTAHSRPTTSAAAMTTPRGTTPRARGSGRRTSTTSRASCTSSPHDPRVPAALHAEMNDVGALPRRIHRHRQLAPPALRPRSAAHGRAIRHVAEGHPDRAHEAGRDRHGLVQQRLAQRPAPSDADGFATRTKATCR